MWISSNAMHKDTLPEYHTRLILASLLVNMPCVNMWMLLPLPLATRMSVDNTEKNP